MRNYRIAIGIICLVALFGCKENQEEVHDHAGHDHSGHDHGEQGSSGHDHGEGSGHDHGDHEGHAHGEAKAGLITFTEAQRAGTDFAVFEVAPQSIHPSIPAFGTLRARSDGEAIVSSPLAGRVLTVGKEFPKVGDDVEQEQRLVSLAPRLEDSADQASLDLDVERAQLALKQAEIDRDRLEELLTNGAVPESRVIASRSAVSTLEAELKAARKRLGQHNRLSRTGGAAKGGIQIRSPITGTITSVEVRPGIFTSEGEVLFHIDDLDSLWLEASVTEANIGRLGEPSSAWFEVDGFKEPFHVEEGHLVAVGGVIDPKTRTTPVIFELANPGRKLRIGMSVKVYLKVGQSRKAPVVPATAVLREEGRDIVMVQVGNESFERRPVKLGIKDREFFEVIEGVKPGEVVVSKGVYAVKLAGSGSAVPAHGHAH